MQGDYIDDAGLGSESGFGTDSGLASGRHVRYNYNNYTKVREPKGRHIADQRWLVFHQNFIMVALDSQNQLQPLLCVKKRWVSFVQK